MTTKTRRMLAAAAVSAALAMTTAPPAEAFFCGPHDQITAFLSSTHKEQREAMALTLSGDLLEVYVSPGGTWTILLTTPKGAACVLSAGESWEGRLIPPGPEA